MTAKIILNPYAARWDALKRQPEAEAALQAAGIDYELIVSEYPGHAIELAAEALQAGFDPIIAAGGDSTYNEIVNGLIKGAGENEITTHFGILPMGTANDLADNLGISKDLEIAAQIIAAGNHRPIDVCQVNGRYFLNNSAVGLETVVSVTQTQMKRVKGIARYLLATILTILKNPQWQMKLTWDDGEYEGPVTLVSVGNNPRTGGIFYSVPHADPFDGKLTFVHGSITTRGEMLATLPKIMKAGEGNYTEHPAIHEIHSTWLRIHAEPSTPFHTDGEVIDYAIHDLEYRVVPGRVPMLLAK
ncbi:MAG: diacylglycerol kinase family lipid kinase [Anaerolineales bacterium]|nr:diacylglycerol kinase family lipid kinase [Anaerolineales bacterium]